MTDFKLHNFQEHFKLAIAGTTPPDLTLYNEIQGCTERYSDFTKVGSGGMKDVYSCFDHQTSRIVAMACLKKTAGKEKYERFIQEAHINAALEHPNIIPIHDVGVNESEKPFFTMKYINGCSLESFCKKEKKALVELMQIYLKICDAIAYAHSKNTIHLDLKPGNIQIDQFGEVLVCDWGLAKIVNTSAKSSDSFCLDPSIYNDCTLDGLIKGSPGYLAPEQIKEEFGSKDQSTDVFALGGILYFLLTNKSPFGSDDLKDSLNKTLDEDFQKPSELAAVNKSLEAVCLKALSQKKEMRYASVLELKQEINSWLCGYATKAENAGFIKSLWLLCKRHKAVSSMLLLFTSITLGFFIENYQTEKKSLNNLRLYVQEKEAKERNSKAESPRLVGLAQLALEESNFDKAVNYITLATLKDSENLDAWKLKARLHFYRQEFSASLKAFSHLEQHMYRRTREATEKLAIIKPEDTQMLDTKHLCELMVSTKNKFAAKKLFDFASINTSSLEEQLKFSLFYLKEIENTKVKKWTEELSVSEELIELDLSGHKKLASLYGLRYLPIGNLNIADSSINSTENILKMPLREINIRNTQILDPVPLFKVKTLKVVYIAKDQYPNIKRFQKLADRIQLN